MSLRKRIGKLFAIPTIEELVTGSRGTNTHHTEAPEASHNLNTSRLIELGNIQETEHFPEQTGVIAKHRLSITDRTLDSHILILGQIGSGKTSLLHLLAERIPERTIFFLNFKGDSETDQKVQAQLSRGTYVPIITIDPEVNSRGYNPFKYGNALAIYSRIIAIIGVGRYEGGSEHFADEHRSAALIMCKADEGPPRSIREIRRRLDETWVVAAYPPHHPKHREAIQILEHERGQFSPWRRFANKLRPILEQFDGVITEDGYTFDEGPVVVSVPAAMYQDSSSKFAELLIEDLKHFMHPASGRQRGPTVVIWDEFQAANNTSITSLLSQSRQFQLGVILATQDINKLGVELQQRVLASDIATTICLRTDHSAEFVTRLAGTIETPAYTARISENQTEAEGSVRSEYRSRIDPNKLAHLPNGHAYLIKHKRVARIELDYISEFPKPPVKPITPVEEPPKSTYRKFS